MRSNEYVELADLRVFLVLTEELHFGRTGERIGLTQSRVSQTIGRLERLVGGRLVERSNRVTDLTPLGRRLRDTVNGPYSDLHLALEVVRGEGATEPRFVQIAMVSRSSAGGECWLRILRTFRDEIPHSRVETVELPLTDILGPLERGEVDLLCTRLPVRPPAGTVVGPQLSEESRVLLVARDHPLADRPHVTLEDLADETLVDVPTLPPELADDLLPRRTPSGSAIRRGPVVRSMSDVLLLVASGEVVHPTARTTPHYSTHPNITSVPILDMPPTRSALLYRPLDLSPAARAFLAVTRRVLAEPE